MGNIWRAQRFGLNHTVSHLNTFLASGSSREKSSAGSLRVRRATTQLRSRSWSRRQPSGEP